MKTILETIDTPGLPELIRGAMKDFFNLYEEGKLDAMRITDDRPVNSLKIETLEKSFELLKNLSIWIMTSCGIDIPPPTITSPIDGSIEFEWKNDNRTYLSINVEEVGNNFSYFCDSVKGSTIFSENKNIVNLGQSRQTGIAEIFKKELSL
jgi:hypothetical protein